MESCLYSSIESERYTKRYNEKKLFSTVGFLFFSITFIIGFSLDEVNTANIRLRSDSSALEEVMIRPSGARSIHGQTQLCLHSFMIRLQRARNQF